jgi:hypothetical protein
VSKQVVGGWNGLWAVKSRDACKRHALKGYMHETDGDGGSAHGVGAVIDWTKLWEFSAHLISIQSPAVLND